MQTFIVIFIVGGCIFYVGRRFYKSFKAVPPSGGCEGGCSSCSSQSSDCGLPEYTDKSDCGLPEYTDKKDS